MNNMKIKDIKELHEKSVDELKKLLQDNRKELLTSRLDLTRGTLKNSSSLTNIRKTIAQVLTVLREKELQ
jgi:large subunit ribosomal protein L29